MQNRFVEKWFGLVTGRNFPFVVIWPPLTLSLYSSRLRLYSSTMS